MKTTLRIYERGDFEEIRQLANARLCIEPWPRIFPDGWSQAEAQRQLGVLLSSEYADICALVAVRDRRLIGIVGGHGLGPFVRHEAPEIAEPLSRAGLELASSYYQRQLFTLPTSNSFYVGRKLFRALRQEAKERGYSCLVTRTPKENTAGQRFFQSLGYKLLFSTQLPARLYYWQPLGDGLESCRQSLPADS